MTEGSGGSTILERSADDAERAGLPACAASQDAGVQLVQVLTGEMTVGELNLAAVPPIGAWTESTIPPARS